MGDPKKIRKKYENPVHPWEGKRIQEEKELAREYGLKNKKEIWKMRKILKNFSDQAKKLITAKGEQAEKEKQQLFNKVKSLGLIEEGATLDDILGLRLRDVLERRLQTQMYRKSFARSMKQARQFISHQHVTVGGRKITQPSYIVPIGFEGSLGFSAGSGLADPEHPERVIISESKAKKEKEKEEEGSAETKEEEKPKQAEKKEEKKEEVKPGKPKEKKPEEKPSEKKGKPEGNEEKKEGADQEDKKEEEKEEEKTG